MRQDYVAHCVSTVLEFGQIIKAAVEREGMLGWQFNAVGVSDAITMGAEGMYIAIRLLSAPDSHYHHHHHHHHNN